MKNHTTTNAEPLVIAVPGIWSGDWNGWAGKLLCAGSAAVPFTVHPLSYSAGPWPRLEALRNWGRARELAQLIRAAARRVVLVAHSNGCAIVEKALRLCRGAVSDVLLIAPAVSKRAVERMPLSGGARVCVWWNEGDAVLRIPVWLKWPWGSAGRVGVDVGPMVEARRWSSDTGHGGYFSEGGIGEISRWISERLTWAPTI